MYKYTFTIFTPTYNRAKTLPRCYKSLISQSFQDFEWLIVDDGSTDETEKTVTDLISEAKLHIRYCKQPNSGKHVAINKGVEMAHGQFFLILDSDDALAPEALNILLKNWKQIPSDKMSYYTGIEGLSYTLDNHLIGSSFPILASQSNFLDSDYLEMRQKYHVSGDKHGFIKTDIMKDFPFPVFGREKFLTEAIVWNQMALKYKTRFINRPIMLKEYLSGGLSDKSTILRILNPIGACAYYKNFLDLPVKLPFKSILRNYINLIRFSLGTKRIKLAYQVKPRYLILLPLALIGGVILQIKDKITLCSKI